MRGGCWRQLGFCLLEMFFRRMRPVFIDGFAFCWRRGIRRRVFFKKYKIVTFCQKSDNCIDSFSIGIFVGISKL